MKSTVDKDAWVAFACAALVENTPAMAAKSADDMMKRLKRRFPDAATIDGVEFFESDGTCATALFDQMTYQSGVGQGILRSGMVEISPEPEPRPSDVTEAVEKAKEILADVEATTETKVKPAPKRGGKKKSTSRKKATKKSTSGPKVDL